MGEYAAENIAFEEAVDFKPADKPCEPSDTTAYQSLADICRYQAVRQGSQAATWFRERRTTYLELEQRSNQIAQALLHAGFGVGDRVVFIGNSSDSFFELLFGCAKVGVILVPVGRHLASIDLATILKGCDVSLVFADSEVFNEVVLLSACVSELNYVVMGESPALGWPNFEQWYLSSESTIDPLLAIDRDAVVLQLYTAGRRGGLKAIMLSHANLLLKPSTPARIKDTCPQWDSSDVVLSMVTVSQIDGIASGLMAYRSGALNVIASQIDPARVLELIRRLEVTKLIAVPAAIRWLLYAPEARNTRYGSLKDIICVAAQIPYDTLREVQEVFGCRCFQLYGLAETAGPISCQQLRYNSDKGGLVQGVGRPFAHVELRIRQSNGQLATSGEVGELETRSSQNMAGYRFEGVCPKRLGSDRWLRTGDVGYINADGMLHICGNVDETIISGGLVIYPAEVEVPIAAHPDVLDVAVIGVPHRQLGEAVKAVVVLKRSSTIGPESIVAFARARLSDLKKLPKSIDFVDRIPRTSSGRVLRRVLQVPYWDRMQ